MTDALPLSYLALLVVLLGGASFFVVRQVLRTRRTELAMAELQNKLLQEKKGQARDYYELGSIMISKKLYVQAIKQLEKALKADDLSDGEPAALVHNALGYGYAAQEQYDLAIRHYKEALKQVPEYVVALNNLALAYERKQLMAQALAAYDQVLSLDPTNKAAGKRAEFLRKLTVVS
ncbi:tetratricopeptide repeat protein [Prochlorothrix hollandica]|uniref:tetratricopeptide repeat protein n=1 Tax=Prochlorothrix hollandica TaxID=1223 RepID=UPI00333E9F45